MVKVGSVSSLFTLTLALLLLNAVSQEPPAASSSTSARTPGLLPFTEPNYTFPDETENVYSPTMKCDTAVCIATWVRPETVMDGNITMFVRHLHVTTTPVGGDGAFPPHSHLFTAVSINSVDLVTDNKGLWMISFVHTGSLTPARIHSTDGGLNWSDITNFTLAEVPDLVGELPYAQSAFWCLNPAVDFNNERWSMTVAGFFETRYYLMVATSTDGLTWTDASIVGGDDDYAPVLTPRTSLDSEGMLLVQWDGHQGRVTTVIDTITMQAQDLQVTQLSENGVTFIKSSVKLVSMGSGSFAYFFVRTDVIDTLHCQVTHNHGNTWSDPVLVTEFVDPLKSSTAFDVVHDSGVTLVVFTSIDDILFMDSSDPYLQDWSRLSVFVDQPAASFTSEMKLAKLRNGVFLATWEEITDFTTGLSGIGTAVLGVKHCYPSGRINDTFCDSCDVETSAEGFQDLVCTIDTDVVIVDDIDLGNGFTHFEASVTVDQDILVNLNTLVVQQDTTFDGNVTLGGSLQVGGTLTFGPESTFTVNVNGDGPPVTSGSVIYDGVLVVSSNVTDGKYKVIEVEGGTATGTFTDIEFTDTSGPCEKKSAKLEYEQGALFVVFSTQDTCEEPFPLPIYAVVLGGVGLLVVVGLIVVFATPSIRNRIFTYRERSQKQFALRNDRQIPVVELEDYSSSGHGHLRSTENV